MNISRVRILFLFVFFLVCLSPLFSQEKIEPAFPLENTGLLFIEGEAAVSTNFTTEPMLLYGASGSRTLQLSRSTGLQGGSPFFAEWVFFLPEGGEYEFWYGGTPPGPSDEFAPSYTSPFTLILDGGGEPVKVFREDVRVTEQYLPAYYWCRGGVLPLDGGVHRLRIEVTEKRTYDGRYFLYLDNFFLVRRDVVSGGGAQSRSDTGTVGGETLGVLPEVFPKDPASDSNLAFLSISDYENRIKNSPEEVGGYLDLASIYSLVNDYANALKILRKAQLLFTGVSDLGVFAAKNRIWKGETAEGLKMYRQVLNEFPDLLDVWAEAGKIAAWSALYADAKGFYLDGLSRFPEDLGLSVNLGLTYLWMADDIKAEEAFDRAAVLAGTDLTLLKKLANVFIVNGYPERGLAVYENAIKTNPADLEFYLLLLGELHKLGRVDEADVVTERMREVFLPSPKLDHYLEEATLKAGLRDDIIARYREQVAANPDNPELRQFLVQTYFWNGRREEAVGEFQAILAAYAYKKFVEMDGKSSDVLKPLDLLYLYLGRLTGYEASLTDKKAELTRLSASYRNAVKAAAKADQAQQTVAAATLEQASDNLARFLDRELTEIQAISSVIEDYTYLSDSFKNIAAQEVKDTGTFRELTKFLSWHWDREFYVSELNAVYGQEPVLAGHVLGRIYQLEGKLKNAVDALSQVGGLAAVRPASVYALTEVLVWGQDWTKANELTLSPLFQEAVLYADYFKVITDILARYMAPSAGSAGGVMLAGDIPEEDLTQLADTFDSLRRDTRLTMQNIRRDLKTLHTIMMNRMIRTFYTLETDTYLLRYELGNYYLTDERLAEATVQFQRVLALDPWNTDAQFKLGYVRQRYGDWSGAMKQYRTVYAADPAYPNAAAYYNLLGKQNPDLFTASGDLFGDNARIRYSGHLYMKTLVNSIFAWDAGYDTDAVRLYKTYGGESPSSHQVHYLRFGFPLSFHRLNLTVRPLVGIAAVSDLFREGSLSPTNQALEPGYFLTMWQAYLTAGGEVAFTLPGFTVVGTWNYGPVKDTLIPNRTPLTSHGGTLSVYGSLAKSRAPFLRLSSARLYGKLEGVSDGNTMGTALEEVVFGIKLFSNPWTTLSIIETASYEDSTVPSVEADNGYYAPGGVLVVKGGALASAWLGLLNGNSLGVSLFFQAGGYWQGLGRDNPAPVEVLMEGSVRAEYVKGDTSCYLNVYASNTGLPGSGVSGYWSMQASLGMNVRLPKLLVN